MAKSKSKEVLIRCADGKLRTQRQIDTKRNGERWLALRYYRKRDEHRKEVKDLKARVSELWEANKALAIKWDIALREARNSATELVELRKELRKKK